ncbi:hypothetical protein GCM10022421_09100 [Oceanisphaera sediminis]|uniref:YCII-related domain-containing protein n=1 Tax=Oceanisphaera sediminis TaxID=981381 RepID=A0ABP7DEG0_9GAMM
MSYLTVYLHAAERQTLHDALAQLRPLDEDNQILGDSPDHHLFWLSDLRRPNGVMLTDGDGNEYPETELVPGCHANLRTRHQSVVDTLTAAGVVVNPVTPMVVFA